MSDFENDQFSDSSLPVEEALFELQLRETHLPGEPENRDAVFFECGRASVAEELVLMRKTVRRYRTVSLAALFACVMLGGAFALRTPDAAPVSVAKQSDSSAAQELEDLKRLFIDARPKRDPSRIGIASSIEDVSRLPEIKAEPAETPSEDQNKPIRAGDLKRWL